MKPVTSLHRGARTETVVVVEDEERVRALSDEALTERRYSMIESPGPAEALRLRADNRQPINLLFTDVVMPDMSGRQLADLARAQQPGMKVLYTTGYTRNAIVHNGMLDPGTSLLTKPFTIEDLALKVRKMLDE